MSFSVVSIRVRLNGSAVSVVVKGNQVPVLNGRRNAHELPLLQSASGGCPHSAEGSVLVFEPSASRAIQNGSEHARCVLARTLDIA